MPDLDVAELARSLEKTTGYLDKFIAAEAQKRANKLAVEYAKAADERIRDNAADMQRLGDLVAELRRQLNVTAQHSASYVALGKALRASGVKEDRRNDAVSVAALLDCIDAGVRAGREERERQQQAKCAAGDV